MGRKRPRVLVDSTNEQGRRKGQVLTEFEQEREEQLARNKARLDSLGLGASVAALAALPGPGQQPQKRLRRAEPGAPRAPRPPAELLPTRVSARQRGLTPAAAADDEELAKHAGPGTEEGKEGQILIPMEDFFRESPSAPTALRVDGRFQGWVCPSVCQRYGIAGCVEEAWEAGGGGKFTFKIDKASIPGHLKARGWSDARAFAATQLLKNPNNYFYRHVAPDEVQAQGEWSEEEHETFMRVVREKGVGDKWGLFASHLRQRVGYQCSAYYREVVLARGLVYDPRFRMTPGGKAIFVG